MVFRSFPAISLPETTHLPHCDIRKLLKLHALTNGHRIAIKQAPVMYRLLGTLQSAKENSRHPARANANEPPSKGTIRPGKPAVGTVVIHRPHHTSGGQWPVRDMETPLYGVAFRAFG